MKNKIRLLILLAVCLLSILLRFYRLTEFPPSLFSDEVDAGYQAFVFNQCGTDYFGNKFPTHFHSFADWRTPFLIYSIAISQRIFGYNEFAVRFPPALFGLLACLVFFLIIKKVSKNFYFGILGFIFLSFNPWFFHYSRAAWEVSGMVLVFLLGILFWLKFLNQKKSHYLYLSLISFCATFYFYATAKLFIIFIFLSLFLAWKKPFLKLTRKQLLTSLILLFLISFPMLIDILKGTAGFRFSYINLFTDPELAPTVNWFRQEDSLTVSFTSKIFHNKPQQLLSAFLKNYLSSFSTDYLFIHGDKHLRQGLVYLGNFYYLDAILIIAGLFLAKTSLSRFFIWLLIFSPIPFSLTRDSISPQSTRLIILSPILTYFSLFGFQSLYLRLNTRQNKNIFLFLFFILYLAGFIQFQHNYRVHYPNISAKEWHYGLKSVIIDSVNNPQWQKVYYSNSYEPFLPFFFFHTQYLPSPTDCNSAGSLKNINNPSFTGVEIKSKYYLGKFEWSGFFADNPNLTNHLFLVPEPEYQQHRSTFDQYHMKIISRPQKDFSSQIPILQISL